MNTFAVIGLGKMGGNLARQALSKGLKVVGYTIGKPADDLLKSGLHAISDLAALAKALPRPRVILLYIPAGHAVDELLDQLSGVLDKDDIVIDGGNSYWGDSIRRHRALRERNIYFIDAGTSGGPDGALRGACFMVGGDAAPVALVTPLLKQLAVPEGFIHVGPPGSGHFVKLVHNGIEFGMLQAIGEGIALLEAYRDKLPIADVLACWRNGSVVRSWLMDLMEHGYRTEGGLRSINAYVEDTGEVNWLVGDAIAMEVPAPVIAQSVMALVGSRDSARNASRAIAMMRHGFGGHPYGPDEGIAHERHEGRVSGFPFPHGPGP